jgi:hypothetical protein
MRSMPRAGWKALSILCLLSGLATAQTPPKAPPPAPARPMTAAEKPVPNPPPVIAKPEPGAPDERRDPTEAKGKLADALKTKTTAAGAAALPKAPLIALKARIISRDQPPAAVIEVDGKLYAIGKDSVIVSAGGLGLKVIEIGIAEIRIEVASLNETIVLR